MKVFKLLLFIILLIFTSCFKFRRNDGEKEIKVFYDTLCPDAISFIKNSYKSFFSIKELNKKLKFLLVPGALMNFETNEQNETYFSCFNGDNECLGNIFHACAIYLLEIETANSYIICYMDNILRFKKNNFSTTSFCSKRLGFSEDLIKKCANSNAGTEYMKLLLKRKTVLDKLVSHVPWIVVNNKYEKGAEDTILDNATSFVCKFTKDDSVAICRSYAEFLSYK